MNTYANVLLKEPQQEAIVAHLTAHQRHAIVGPTINGFTFVYTPFDEWTTVAEELSRSLQCPALFTFGYDSDVFGYTLYDDGRIHDEYESAPNDDATDSRPNPSGGSSGGKASMLCHFVGVDYAVAQVEGILYPSVEGLLRQAGIDAFDQHWALAEALGLPPHACVQSYETLRVDDYARTDTFGGAPLIETP